MELVETPENLFLSPYYEDRLKDIKVVRFSCPFAIKPKDFIDIAKQDLNQDDERGLINALTNIKRAIECQIDSLLFYFGFSKIARDRRWGFPKKTRILQDIGILTPNILNSINSRRVRLEHFYESPEKERVEDAFDVGVLFIEFTNKYLPLRRTTGTSFLINGKYVKTKTGTLESLGELSGNFSYDHKEGKLRYSIKTRPNNEVVYSIEIGADDPKYIEWMNLLKNLLFGLEVD